MTPAAQRPRRTWLVKCSNGIAWFVTAITAQDAMMKVLMHGGEAANSVEAI